MYVGLIVSVMLHATLLGWAVVSIMSTPAHKERPQEVIAVDVISPSELTRVTQGSREAKLKQATPKEAPKAPPAPKEAERSRPAAAAAPPPPPPPTTTPPPPPPPETKAAPPPPAPPATAAPPPPTPEPDKAALEMKLADLAREQAEAAEREAKARAETERQAAEAKRLAEEKRKAEQQRRADEKRKAEQKRRADAKRREDERKRKEAQAKKQFDADRLSALLDKAPDPRGAAPVPPTDSQTTAKGPVLGAPDGRDTLISASEAAFLAGLMRQAVSRCWNINAGLEGVDKMIVKVEVRLAPDGSLAIPPKVVNSAASPLFRDAADSAVRALVQCAPYTLPPDKYKGGWEHMVVTFDPARMF